MKFKKLNLILFLLFLTYSLYSQPIPLFIENNDNISYGETIDLKLKNINFDYDLIQIELISKETNEPYFLLEYDEDNTLLYLSHIYNDNLIIKFNFFKNLDLINTFNFDIYVKESLKNKYFFCDLDDNCKNYFLPDESFYLKSKYFSDDIYNIKIKFDGFLYLEEYSKLPFKISLPEGLYSVLISKENFNYDQKIVIGFKDDYKYKPYFFDDSLDNNLEETIIKGGEEDIISKDRSFHIILIIIFLILIFILFFVYKNKRKKKDNKNTFIKNEKNNLKNRREKRHFIKLFLIILFFLIFLPNIHSSDFLDGTYTELEVTYKELEVLFPYPSLVNLNITPSKNQNHKYIPLIVPTTYVETNPIEGISKDVKEVYFLTNKNTDAFKLFKNQLYDDQGFPVSSLAKEIGFILDFYYLNPVEDKLSLINRTYDNLTSVYDKVAVDYLINHKIIIPKPYLLKIEKEDFFENYMEEKTDIYTINFKDQFLVDFKPIQLNVRYVYDGLITYFPNKDNFKGVDLIASEKGWDVLSVNSEDFKHRTSFFSFNNVFFKSLNTEFLITRFDYKKQNFSLEHIQHEILHSFILNIEDIPFNGYKINLCNQEVNLILVKSNGIISDYLYFEYFSTRFNLSPNFKYVLETENQIKNITLPEISKTFLMSYNILDDTNYFLKINDDEFFLNENGFYFLDDELIIIKTKLEENKMIVEFYLIDESQFRNKLNFFIKVKNNDVILKYFDLNSDILFRFKKNNYSEIDVIEIPKSYVKNIEWGDYLINLKTKDPKAIKNKKYEINFLKEFDFNYKLKKDLVKLSFENPYHIIASDNLTNKLQDLIDEKKYLENTINLIDRNILPNLDKNDYFEKLIYVNGKINLFLKETDTILIKLIFYDNKNKVIYLNINEKIFEYDFKNDILSSPNLNLKDFFIEDFNEVPVKLNLNKWVLNDSNKDGNVKYIDFFTEDILVDYFNLTLKRNARLESQIDFIDYIDFKNNFNNFLKNNLYDYIYRKGDVFSGKGDYVPNENIISLFLQPSYRDFLTQNPGSKFNLKYIPEIFECDFLTIDQKNYFTLKVNNKLFTEEFIFNEDINIQQDGVSYTINFTLPFNFYGVDDNYLILKMNFSKTQNFENYNKDIYFYLNSDGSSNNFYSLNNNDIYYEIKGNEFISDFEIIEINFPEYNYQCNFKKIDFLEEIKLEPNKEYNGLVFSDWFTFTDYDSLDNVLKRSKGIDLFGTYNEESNVYLIQNYTQKYVFPDDLNINNYILGFNLNKMYNEEISFNLFYPDNLNKILKNEINLFEKYSLIKNNIFNEGVDKSYTYGLIIGNKFTFPQQLTFNELLFSDAGNSEAVLDFCYFNRCKWDGINYDYKKDIYVGRLPFNNYKDVREYYSNLSFNTKNPVISEIYYPDDEIIFYEEGLGVLNYLNINPNLFFNSEILYFNKFSNLKNINYDPSTIYNNFNFYINPGNKHLDEAIKKSDFVVIDTHGAKRFFKSKEESGFEDDYFFDIESDFFENRPGIFGNTCNSAFYFGESLIKSGVKFYFGFLYPVLTFIYTNPVYFNQEVSLGHHLSNQIRYYHSYYLEKENESIGVLENFYPFVLLGDPSFKINTFNLKNNDNLNYPVLFLGDDSIFINFKNRRLDGFLYYFKNISLKHSIRELTVNFERNTPNHITLTESDIQKILSETKKYNQLDDIKEPIFLESLNADLDLNYYWFAGKISFLNENDNVYLTINEKLPLVYDTSTINKKNIEEYLINNQDLFLEVFINGRLVYEKDVSVDHHFNGFNLFFNFTYKEFLYFINKGILDYDYQIRIKSRA